MKTPPAIGDRVSLERRDASERPANKLGSPGVVIDVESGQRCESGFMVTVRGSRGQIVKLDRNWLLPFEQ